MKKEEFIFCPLGGSGEIGMNMNLFAYGNPENRKWLQNRLLEARSAPGPSKNYLREGFHTNHKKYMNKKTHQIIAFERSKTIDSVKPSSIS